MFSTALIKNCEGSAFLIHRSVIGRPHLNYTKQLRQNYTGFFIIKATDIFLTQWIYEMRNFNFECSHTKVNNIQIEHHSIYSMQQPPL